MLEFEGKSGVKGKVIVFLGAGGIATSTVKYLAGAGALLVISDLIAESAEATAAAARALGAEARSTTVDISDPDQVKAVMDFAVAEFGRIDGLFNVAAELNPEIFNMDFEVAEIDLAVWQRVLDVNLTGYLLAIKYALPHMEAGSSIVNMSSDAAYNGLSQVSYGATKAAITSLTRHVAQQHGQRGVRCNAISPGAVMTPGALAVLPKEVIDEQLRITALPRLGSPEDVGALAAFLLSDHSEWITGQVISVNGGSIMRP